MTFTHTILTQLLTPKIEGMYLYHLFEMVPNAFLYVCAASELENACCWQVCVASKLECLVYCTSKVGLHANVPKFLKAVTYTCSILCKCSQRYISFRLQRSPVMWIHAFSQPSAYKNIPQSEQVAPRTPRQRGLSWLKRH